MQPELENRLAAELAETEKVLGPLPGVISLKTITRDFETLHGVALMCILEECREQKSYDFLQHFYARLKAEQSLRDAAKRYVVRSSDVFERTWTTITPPLSREDAEKVYMENTSDGTRHTRYEDGYYYKIFPADSTMLHSGD